MDQDSLGVTLRGGGWPGPIATASAFCERPVRAEGGVSFTLYSLPSLTFAHATSLLVLQGMALQDLFPPDVRFEMDAAGRTLAEGPFVLLAGVLSKPWDLPSRLEGVVLGKVVDMPEGMTRDELLSLMLGALAK